MRARSYSIFFSFLALTACASTSNPSSAHDEAALIESKGLSELIDALNEHAGEFHDTYTPIYGYSRDPQTMASMLDRTDVTEQCHPVSLADARTYLIDLAAANLPDGADVETRYGRALDEWEAAVRPSGGGTLEQCGYRYFADSAYEGKRTTYTVYRTLGVDRALFSVTVTWS